VHTGVLEFVSDQPEAKEQDAEVVFCAGFAELARAFGAGAFRSERLGREGEAKVDVAFGDSGVVDAVEKSEFDCAHPPYVVEVKASVAGAVVVFRIRVGVAEPCLVQFFLGVWLRGFEAGDEFAVGRLGVAPEAAVVRSGGLEEESFLLVVDSREVGDLPRRKAFHADVDVLAGDFAVGLCSGLAEGSDDLLQGFDVVVAEDGRDHLGGGGAASEAGVADRFPFASRNVRHRPAVVGAAGVAHRAADHAVDRLRRLFAADVRIFQFGSEFQLFHLFHRFVHFRGLPFGC